MGRWAGDGNYLSLLPFDVKKCQKGAQFSSQLLDSGQDKNSEKKENTAGSVTSTKLYSVLHLLPKTKAHLPKISGLIKDDSNGQTRAQIPQGFSCGKTTLRGTAMLRSSWLAKLLLQV